MTEFAKIGAIILAAGKGTRMASAKPKAIRSLAGKPMIFYPLETLTRLGFGEIVVVVGFKADQVRRVISQAGYQVSFAYQEEQLGTAHAAGKGAGVLSGSIEHFLTLNADDSAFLTSQTITKLKDTHFSSLGKVSVLTVDHPNPGSFGRILRDQDGRLIGVVEAKLASPKERLITEINTNCYLFDRQWFASRLKRVPRDQSTGEYFLPELLCLAVQEGEEIASIKLEEREEFFGVNRPEELKEAGQLMRQKIKFRKKKFKEKLLGQPPEACL